MSVVKNIVYILAILLFVSSYSICDFFYYNDEIKDIQKWWGLKYNIYAVIMMLVFYGSLLKNNKFTRLIINLGLGLCVANVIDKVYFNVLEFTYNDIIMIITTIAYASYSYLNELQNARYK